MSIYLGLMSGTSMDGIDAALVDVTTHRLLGGLTKAYSPEVYDRIQNLMIAETITLPQVWQLNTLIGKQFGDAANDLLQQCGYDCKAVTAIGSHGQTILHDVVAATPYTIQLACPHTIAEATGLTVVADFRTRDVVLGGKGAPFAPLYHQEVFGQDATPLAVVNLGGIANMTVLSQRIQTYGYDLGPGNCLMDAWIQKQLGQPYDRNGAYAAQGVVIPELLEGLLTDDYFQLPYPKSVCKSYFSLAWLQRWLRPNYAAQDVQATLLALTVKTIVQALNMNVLPIQRLAVCGGGAHNQAVLGHLRRWLPEVLVKSTKDLGVDPDFLEAMMFAWLAHQTLTGTPLDLTHITGAMKPTILGAIYPA